MFTIEKNGRSNDNIEYKMGLECFNNKNYDTAFDYFKMAFNNKCFSAEFMLGLCYLEGLGVTKSLSKGLNHIENAAKNGNVNAICSLGDYYYGINSENHSYKKAFKWNMQAAKLNCRHAQYLLGCSYMGGNGVSKSIPLGIYWLNKAAGYGHLDAIKKLLKYKNINNEDKCKA